MADKSLTRQAEDVAHVWELMQEIDICMFASRDGEKIRARPMAAHPREAENAIYFLTHIRGHKEEELAADDNVSLSFASPGAGRYLVVAGRARMLNDRAIIRELWDTSAEAWWNGSDDPGVRVIEVAPDDAQFWEGPHGIVANVLMAMSAYTSAPPPLGDQRKVDLQ